MVRKLDRRFGNLLIDLRRQANLTQSKLAKKAKLSVTCVAMLERGERQPSLIAACKLALALSVSINLMVPYEWMDKYDIRYQGSQ